MSGSPVLGGGGGGGVGGGHRGTEFGKGASLSTVRLVPQHC